LQIDRFKWADREAGNSKLEKILIRLDNELKGIEESLDRQRSRTPHETVTGHPCPSSGGSETLNHSGSAWQCYDCKATGQG